MKVSTKKQVRILVVVSVIIVITFSFVSISTRTYEFPTVSPLTPQAALNSFVVNDIPHYNFKVGYVNFTQKDRIVSFAYLLRPFNGLNPVEVGSAYYSANYAVSSTLSIIDIYQITSNSSINSVPFSIGNLTVNSPEGFSGGIQTWYDVTSNSLGLIVNPPGTLNEPDPLSPALENYPGFHHFYLNFTITMYNTFGPYKFTSQSQNVHLEFNNTVVV
ncbi:MAG: hypothetical protein M1129_01260 [Candidatus Thermoplasmatota archaeon]|jgi:hypothetical protein|nr:hypothetical protein [Candidatus Thermoplasmatota archaeon]MCL6089564.1 hypothetical protein [Candidatus Thermoplasmatota archaeon]